jgi:hypothetical protein
LEDYIKSPWFKYVKNKTKLYEGRCNWKQSAQEEAAKVYDKKAKELLGDKAKLNFS